MAEPGKGTTTASRFLESGPARLVGLVTDGPASKFVTDVTLPGASLLQGLGPGARKVVREWVLVVREEWAQG